MIELLLDSVAPQKYRPNTHVGLMAAAFHKGVMTRLARHVAGHPQAHALLAQNHTVLGSPPPLTSACWQPEIGATLEHIKQNRPLAAVLQALFAMHALRTAGAWMITLDTPVRLGMAGHLFDVRGDIRVDASAERICIHAHQQAPLTLAWSDAGWRLTGAPPHSAWRYAAPAFFASPGFESSYVQLWEAPLSEQQGMDLRLAWPQQPVHAPCHALGEAVCAQMQEVFTLFEQIGPAYRAWCQPVLRGIAACPSHHPDMRSSASFPAHAGVISVAFPLATPHLAEIVVHELSHQYYLMLNTITPLLQKDAGATLHYSSLKNRARPLNMLFFAYHATSNMTLFWHDVVSASVPGAERAEQELARQLRHTESLDANIAASGGLSEAGRAMFDHQRGLLSERGLLH